MVEQVYVPFLLLIVRSLTHIDQVFDPGGESGHQFPSSLLLTAEIKAPVCPVGLFQLVAFLECSDDGNRVCFVD